MQHATKAKELFDTAFQQKQRARWNKNATSLSPAFAWAVEELEERLSALKIQPTGFHDSKAINNHLSERLVAKGFIKSPAPWDLITSCLSLQTQNNLQDCLKNMHSNLNHGGLLHGVLMGDGSLQELRTSLSEAELSLTGFCHPRVAPLPPADTLTSLLAATGFQHVVVDKVLLSLSFTNLIDLVQTLRRHGCANALTARPRHFAPRTIFKATEDIYKSRFLSDQKGLCVSLNLIFFHGWKES